MCVVVVADQTTSMCHTVAEPYCGKYLISCSQEAIRVWSYEAGIEVGSCCPFVGWFDDVSKV